MRAMRKMEPGDADPLYWVIDDQYNHEMYQYVEFPKGVGCTADWLSDVTAMLKDHAGWGIGVGGISDGYLLIFADRLMVQGEPFRDCADAASVLRMIQRSLRKKKSI
jgi:hypothetical protein